MKAVAYPYNSDKMKLLQKATSARIGEGRCGCRYTTSSMLRFLGDHAAAHDAVAAEVDREFLGRMGLFEVQTRCTDKHEMLVRPDLGRVFSEEAREKIKKNCIASPDVQIYVGDGLCAPSVTANIPTLLPAIVQQLLAQEISVGTPFFVRYCRVNTARVIGPLLDAKVCCVLLGERPGLLTPESMSAYIAWRPHPDMLESEYTVVSNISRVGMPPSEAAPYIAELLQKILHEKKSGRRI